MKMAGRAALVLTGVLLAALLLAACGGGGDDGLTDREITDEELSLMVLSQAELGADYADFRFDADESGYESNEDRIADDEDQEDEAQDIEKFGRLNGYRASYSNLQALLGESGPFAVSVGVQLFEDGGGAEDYANDSIAERLEQEGEVQDGALLEEVTRLDVEKIGDLTEAYRQKVVIEDDEGDRIVLYATFVGFREGRILGGVNLGRVDDQDVSEEGAALARKLHDRVIAVLEGEVTPEPAAESPPSADTATVEPSEPSTGVSPSDFLDTFRFTSDISVSADGGIVLNVEGAYQAPDRIACNISGGIGEVTFARDKLIVIGDDAWLDTGSGWETTTASDPDVQSDLDLCPGSPGYWSDLDFIEDLGALAGGDQETVNDVPAVRYDVGGAFEGLSSLGLLPPDLEGVEIELFEVWLAEDGDWPVAMEMIASGDAEAWAEAMIIPASEAGTGEASLEMRIDISDVDDPSISVEPPEGQ